MGKQCIYLYICINIYRERDRYIDIYLPILSNMELPRWLRVKNLPASEGDLGSIPGPGRSPGGGIGNPLQYSCLGDPMDRGA